mmetsp:Transcript_20634/g.22918  ORF Transcript_20634/g.22918 Transcript_20634/m.22918 type:complete len:292 (+) Transcript_20634:67-942(+)
MSYDKPVYFKNKCTGLVFETKQTGQMVTNKEVCDIIQSTLKETDNAKQLYKIEKSDIVAGKQTYKITAFNNDVLDILYGEKKDGTRIITYYWHGSNTQRWYIEDHEGYKVIINVNSGKCVEVPGSTTEQGAALLQFTSNHTDNQLWSILTEEQAKIKPVPVPSDADTPTSCIDLRYATDSPKWRRYKITSVSYDGVVHDHPRIQIHFDTKGHVIDKTRSAEGKKVIALCIETNCKMQVYGVNHWAWPGSNGTIQGLYVWPVDKEPEWTSAKSTEVLNFFAPGRTIEIGEVE